MARRASRTWEAVAAAALLNAALVIGLDHVTVSMGRVPEVAIAPPPAPLPRAEPVGPAGLAGFGVVTTMPPALPLEAFLGTGDHAAGHGQPPRPSTADLPGDRAADRGGGAAGGVDTWIERRDRADDAALRSRVWTSDQAYLAPRRDDGRRARSPEAVNRAPDARYGDRAPQPLARPGEDQARVGAAAGPGASGVPTAVGVDDTRAGAAGATAPVRVDGAARPTQDAAYVDRGAAAVDVARRGATADDRAVAAASDQRRPDPYDLTPPRAGGAAGGEGVRGDRGAGAAPDGWGSGTAAARLDGPAGDDGAPTYASRRDPYFQELFRRLDQRVEYPHDLALSLTSGRVVAALVLHADGSFSDIAVHASSGHDGFDRELTDALRAVARLGPVPPALLAGRTALRVRIPYTFKNPVIQ